MPAPFVFTVMGVGMDERQIQIEREKAIGEYLKHLTTLSTGSILLIIGFFQNIFIYPQVKFLVGVALAAFTLAVIGAVAAQSLLVFTMGVTKKQTLVPVDPWFDVATIGAWVCFLFGVMALGTFALMNFFVLAPTI